MSDESESNKASKVIEDNLNRLNKCIIYLEASHTEISTQFNTLKNQGSTDNSEWETVLNLFKKGCDIAAKQLADIQKNFGDVISNIVSDKHLNSTSKSKDGSSKNDDTNTKKNLKTREVTKDIEINNTAKENIGNHVNSISGSKNIEDDFNKENCPIIQSDKNDDLGNEFQKNSVSLNGDNVSAEKNCDEKVSENATENGEVEPNPSKIGIRLVAIEKLLDPNIAARSKELNITQPIVNNNANSSIIILDSDDDDEGITPAFSVTPFKSSPLVPPLTHISSSSNVRTSIKEKVNKNATKRKRTKEKGNKLKRIAVKIKRSRIIAQLIRKNKKKIIISKSLAKKLNAIVLDNKVFTSLTTSKKASDREKVKSTTINKGPERVHSSNDDLEKRTNSNKSSEKELSEKGATTYDMEFDNSDDTSTTKEYTVGPKSRRKLKKKTQSKSIPTPSCSNSSEDERASKNKQESKTSKNGADLNVEKHKHKKKHVRTAKYTDSSDEGERNTTRENKMLKSSEKSSTSSEISEKVVNRCESVGDKPSNLESKNQNKKNDGKEKNTSDCNNSIKNDEKSGNSKTGESLNCSDRDTEDNSPPKKIKISSDNKSSSKIKSSESKSKSKDKPANISDIDSLSNKSIKTSSSKEKAKKNTDVEIPSSQNKSNENKSLQESPKNKSAKSSDTDSSDNERMGLSKEKSKKNTVIKTPFSENKSKESTSQLANAKSANTSDTDSSDDENMQTKSSKEKTKQNKSEESISQSSSKSKSPKCSETDSSDDESKKLKSSKEKTKKENSKESKSKSKSSKVKSGKTSDIDSLDTESMRSNSLKKKIKDKEEIKSNSSKSKSNESKSQISSNVKAASTAITNSSNKESMRSSSPIKETTKDTDNRSSSSKSQSSSETKKAYNSDSDSSDSSDFASNKERVKEEESVSSTENDDDSKTKSRSRSKSKQSDDSSDTESIKNSSSQEKMESENLAKSNDEDQESRESLADKNASEEESSKNSDEDNCRDSSDSEIINTKKRKRAKSQSNSSKSSDDTKAASTEKKKRKRKIIRHNDSDSNNSESNSPSTRKNIRKLIKKKDLDDDTKKAAKEEEQRRKRIEERQKLYNSIYEKPQSTEIEELVLDFDAETKEKLLEVDKSLLKKLKPHQANGVKFMWDACFETIKDAGEKPGSGCILGHCMGLGKTLQVITLTHTLLTNSRKTGVERVLVITPLSTLTNWAKEYKQWMKYCKKKDVEVYDMSRWKERNLRISKLNEWFEEGGVCIIGYDMFRILSNPKSVGVPKKKKPLVQKALIDPGPDIVICDEGHLLKNEKTTISQAVNKLRTQRRIVLTGTPLQNNLKEYYCMIQFIKPNLLGTYKEYLNRFVNPITNGQYTDSTARDIQLMKNRAHILHKLLEGCIQRRDYSVLAPYLPPKHEYVVYISCSEMQKKLYEFYMTEQRNTISESSTGGKGAMLFQDLQNLRRIWTHPMSLRLNSDTVIKKKIAKDLSDSEGSLKDFIDDNDESTSSSSTSSSSDSSDSERSDAGKKNFPKRGTRRTRGNIDPVESLELPKTERSEDPSEWWMSHCPEPELTNINHSPKLVLLMNVLERCEAIGDKVLLFSQSLQSLDVIEHFLSLIDKKTEGEEIQGDVGEFEGTWAPGIDYFRLDGSSSVDQREAMCNAFNDVNNLRARLFLISTRAGSLGINLVAANRVIIFDVSWNPSHDTQSIFRVYRFGQTKPCYIYRFIAMGTMEQKVYERQVAKQATAKRVLDEQQIGRHYNQNDLLELYKYELEPTEVRETPILPKDRLFAELLSKFEKLIYKYHEHDSLLENEESENLTEEERKAAWAEYEAEKERPAQQFVAYNRQNVGNGPVTSSKIFGLRTDVLLQLLNMKVSQDHPNLNDTERIRLVPSYLSQLYAEMNVGNTSLYRELIHLNAALQMPYMYNQGMPPMVGINPFAYGNAGQMANRSEMQMNNPPTDSQIYEID